MLWAYFSKLTLLLYRPTPTNSLVPENIQKTLLISAQIHTCPDSNNKIYTQIFSEQPQQVPVLIIHQEKTTPSTPYKKVQDRILKLPPTSACDVMSEQEWRYNFKPTLLPEITHFKLIFSLFSNHLACLIKLIRIKTSFTHI